MKSAAEILKTYRKKHNFSQREIAEWMGLSCAQSVSNVERGLSPLPVHWIPVLEVELSIPRGMLLTAFLSQLKSRIEKRMEK